MDFNLKQWRVQQQQQQQESEEEEEQQQQPAKIPRQLFLETPQEVAALPLFVSSDSEPQPNKITTHFSSPSPYSSTTPTAISRFPRAGQCFSISQWQELELQALIFKHMMAGAVVPQELLQLVKRSLLSSSVSPFYNLHHYPPHFQPPPALVQAGYWGKGAMDPEPGRCRRTDGKKWRCSRDVVIAHKYCERHMHRGRNRSRKPVELPPSTASGMLNNSAASAAFTGGSNGGGGSGGGPQFSLSGSGPSLEAFQLNQGSSELSCADKKSSNNNKVLMHFFDDWPRSLQGGNSGERNGNSSSTSLTMSNTGNSTSDFLRLSTGNGIELGGNEERHRAQLGWTAGWGANQDPVAVIGVMGGGGGPLAEAFRSSSHSSPTSVLHQLPRASASDTNYVTA